MRTRWEELEAQLSPLARELEIGDLGLVRALAGRAGWGVRSVDAPLLPSGLRHGVPWGVSLAMADDGDVALRVFLEAQADPPTPSRYLASAHALLDGYADLGTIGAIEATRMWHAVAFTRGRAAAFHAYACVPDYPERGWAWLTQQGHDSARLRDAMPPRARVTIVSADLAPDGRRKLYALIPDAHINALPFIDDAGRAFARAVHPSDEPIGWLVCYAFRPGDAMPSAVAVHYAVAVHGRDARVAAHLRARGLTAFDRACTALGRAPAMHFVAHTSDRGSERVTVYLQPEART